MGTVVADVTRFEPTTTGHLRFALLQGNDQKLPLAEQVEPAAHREAPRARRPPARPLRPHRVPGVRARHRPGAGPGCAPTRRTGGAARRRACSRTRARRGDDGQSCNANLLYTPDGKLQGTYAKQHLVPFGEYVPWRDALSWHAASCARCRTTSSPGDDPHAVPRRRAPVRIGDLLRVRVRAARARHRARRRASSSS